MGVFLLINYKVSLLKQVKVFVCSGLVTIGVLLPNAVMSHGDVQPQAVDTTGLPELGEQWVDTNPFRGSEEYEALATKIGASAYNQNCARCHGLEAISGGIAPDLRELGEEYDDDLWYVERVRNGAVRDGRIYMPPFEGLINQEGLWAIRTYIDSRPD